MSGRSVCWRRSSSRTSSVLPSSRRSLAIPAGRSCSTTSRDCPPRVGPLPGQGTGYRWRWLLCGVRRASSRSPRGVRHLRLTRRVRDIIRADSIRASARQRTERSPASRSRSAHASHRSPGPEKCSSRAPSRISWQGRPPVRGSRRTTPQGHRGTVACLLRHTLTQPAPVLPRIRPQRNDGREGVGGGGAPTLRVGGRARRRDTSRRVRCLSARMLELACARRNAIV